MLKIMRFSERVAYSNSGAGVSGDACSFCGMARGISHGFKVGSLSLLLTHSQQQRISSLTLEGIRSKMLSETTHGSDAFSLMVNYGECNHSVSVPSLCNHCWLLTTQGFVLVTFPVLPS